MTPQLFISQTVHMTERWRARQAPKSMRGVCTRLPSARGHGPDRIIVGIDPALCRLRHTGTARGQNEFGQASKAALVSPNVSWPKRKTSFSIELSCGQYGSDSQICKPDGGEALERLRMFTSKVGEPTEDKWRQQGTMHGNDTLVHPAPRKADPRRAFWRLLAVTVASGASAACRVDSVTLRGDWGAARFSVSRSPMMTVNAPKG